MLALDAAQPFDFEHRMQHKISKDKQLTIGIVGFGTFGQFLAKRFVQAGHRWEASLDSSIARAKAAAVSIAGDGMHAFDTM